MKKVVGFIKVQGFRLWEKCCIFFLCAVVFFPVNYVYAAGARLSDSAGILSTQEFAVAEKNLNYIVERYEVTVHLFTSEKIGKKDSYQAYVNKQRKKEKEKDLLLLFLSSKKGEELCYIKAYGKAGKNLTQKRLADMERAVEKKLVKEEYAEAVHLLNGRLLDNMGTRPVFDLFIFHPFLHFLGFVLLTTGILYGLLRKSSPGQIIKGIPYFNEKYSTSLGTLDHFSHMTVKAVKQKRKKGKGGEDEFSELPEDFE